MSSIDMTYHIKSMNDAIIDSTWCISPFRVVLSAVNGIFVTLAFVFVNLDSRRCVCRSDVCMRSVIVSTTTTTQRQGSKKFSAISITHSIMEHNYALYEVPDPGREGRQISMSPTGREGDSRAHCVRTWPGGGHYP